MAKVKGSLVLAVAKGLRKLRERATPELDESLHIYLNEPISLAAWYSEGEFLVLIRTLVKILPEDSIPAGKDPFVWIGELGATLHQDGVYAHLFDDFKLSTVSARALALWHSQHDTGHLKIRTESPGHAEVELTDFGHPLREMCLMTHGYVQESFRFAGLSDFEMQEKQCIQLQGERCQWECNWDSECTPSPSSNS